MNLALAIFWFMVGASVTYLAWTVVADYREHR